MNMIVSNTTRGRCTNDADALIEAGIAFRFERHEASGAYCLYVDYDNIVKASQVIKTARDSY